jgi:putative phosphoesterase
VKIGIISDTHDQIPRIKKAVEIFKNEKIELLIHCGDLVAPLMLNYFKDLSCPMKFIFGNNSGDIALHLQVAKKLGLNAEFSNFFSLEIEGRRIAVYHGDIPEITKALIDCGSFDCVFSGHDHVARIERYCKVLFINPGTLLDKHKEEMKEPSVAIYDTKIHEARLIFI